MWLWGQIVSLMMFIPAAWAGSKQAAAAEPVAAAAAEPNPGLAAGASAAPDAAACPTAATVTSTDDESSEDYDDFNLQDQKQTALEASMKVSINVKRILHT